MLKRTIFILALVIAVFTSYSVVSALSNARVIINGEEAVFETMPIFRNGHIFVPLRGVAERLGASITWDRETNSISLTIIQTITSRPLTEIVGNVTSTSTRELRISLNSRNQDILVVNGRTMVRLRKIAEYFGAIVEWDGNTRTALIKTPDPTNRAYVPKEHEKDVILSNGNILNIGMSEDEIVRILGRPARVEPTLNGYDWWVYNDDLQHFSMIGMADNRVVSMYSVSPEWSIDGISPGNSVDETLRIYSQYRNVPVMAGEQKVTVFIFNQMRIRVIPRENAFVAFYVDTHRDHTISAIRITDKSFYIKNPHSVTIVSGMDAPEVKHTKEQQDKVWQAEGRIMHDLVNSFRVKKGRSVLIWRDDLARLAKSHSQDMKANNFFAHISPTTGCVNTRAVKAGFPTNTVGENLATGHKDAIEAQYFLTESLGHRINMLRHQYRYAGMGIIGKYSTQKFKQPH